MFGHAKCEKALAAMIEERHAQEQLAEERRLKILDLQKSVIDLEARLRSERHAHIGTSENVTRLQQKLQEIPAVRVKEAVEKMLMGRDDVRYRLGATEENDPLWVAVRKVILAQIEAEGLNAHAPGLSDSERQFAAGSVAAAERCLAVLTRIREEARQEMMEERKAA